MKTNIHQLRCLSLKIGLLVTSTMSTLVPAFQEVFSVRESCRVVGQEHFEVARGVQEILQKYKELQDIISILPYVLTLLLLVFFSSTNRAPRALGEIYAKGIR